MNIKSKNPKTIDFLLAGYPSLDYIIKVNNSLTNGRTSLIKNDDFNEVHYGGCNVNIAYNLSELDLNTGLLMNVGEDFSKSGFESFLLDSGINLDGVKKVEGELTSHSLLITDPEGEHTTLFYPGAAKKPGIVPNNLIKNSKYVVITVGNWKHNKGIMQSANNEEVPVILGMKGDYSSFPLDGLDKFIKDSTILVMNEAEKRDLIKLLDYQSINQLFGDKTELIIVTKGCKGSTILKKNKNQVDKINIPICSTKNVVDTSGVGDAYLAGFIYGYSNNYSLKKSGKIASVMASFAIEKRGCLNNVPNLKQLKKRYKDKFNEELIEINTVGRKINE